VTVCLRQGLDVCSSHVCHCGSAVDVRGIHSFICKKTPGKIIRHQALNDLIARSVSAADVPVIKEPSGLLRSDGKRPGGLSLVPRQSGKALCWDLTVICPLADSYISDAAREPGSVAELAASRKEAKYAVLDGSYMFVPIAFENLGVPNASAKLLLTHLGRRLSEKSGESRETFFLFQRCSVLLQRFNAVLLHDSMPARF